MRKGKMVAQGAHASVNVILENLMDDNVKKWLSDGLHTKIVLSVDSELELIEIFEKSKSLSIITTLITDAGLTEFNGIPTKTCIAIGPADSNKLQSFTGHLKLL